MSTRKAHGKRSFTGNHPLLPAMRPEPPPFIPKVPTYAFLKWTFGRGSVIWKIWPAVLLHTLFATGVVYGWEVTGGTIDVPNVMLTVMGLGAFFPIPIVPELTSARLHVGVVIGFVISYRAMSGYDRYWMGRTAWTDVIRNARTMGRLIWYHVPPRLTPGTNANRPPQEMAKVMAEKRMALDLVEAFAVALKHHLRGELGIYYVDLYDLVRPLHDFTDPANPRPTVASTPAPASSTSAPPASTPSAASTSAITDSASSSGVSTSTGAGSNNTLKVTTHAAKRPAEVGSSANGHASQTSIHQPLLPASNPAPEEGVLRRVSPDVIPFAGVVAGVTAWLRGWRAQHKEDKDRHRRGGNDRSSRIRTWSGPIHPTGVAQLEEFEKGENLPEEVLRCLSEWVSVLEERGTVPGTSLGSILGGIQAFEMSLTMLEHILTTPLPFVYSVHIRCVRSRLSRRFFLLTDYDFWSRHAQPVCVGAFVYLGFVAAGEEIEQPFGYDDNDLDLDMFCREIIRQDIQCLKKAPCLNAWFPPKPSITGDANAPEHGSLLSPEAATLSAMHAYGGNMYRASLASLSDTASITEEEEGTESDVDTETEGEARTRRVEESAREGELVDVR
ncbi:hypothetical protein MVEN_01110200 [Mycena venus]|uniref:Uncharacterized protein n=1 Tax=Mycena venus TaxID=2733690 RepID=A0A8H6Y882_9AGAR|nr:hypothetical protein MVEN_01110200 [Mycena venus]